MFFRSPFPYLAAHASRLTRMIPARVLARILSDWPEEQLFVLRSLLNSPSSIFAALTMAHDEMQTIRELDVHTLQIYSHRIHLYFAEEDDWVGDQRNAILRAFDQDQGSVKIVYGHQNIPHAFCISESSFCSSLLTSTHMLVFGGRSWRRSGRELLQMAPFKQICLRFCSGAFNL